MLRQKYVAGTYCHPIIIIWYIGITLWSNVELCTKTRLSDVIRKPVYLLIKAEPFQLYWNIFMYKNVLRYDCTDNIYNNSAWWVTKGITKRLEWKTEWKMEQNMDMFKTWLWYVFQNNICSPDKMCNKIAYFCLFVTKLYASHLENTFLMLGKFNIANWHTMNTNYIELCACGVQLSISNKYISFGAND